MTPFVLLWGGGDLASGVAIRLHRAGLRVVVVETFQPLAIRRSVAFAQAVYDGSITIEGIKGELVESFDQIEKCWSDGGVPVIVDPELELVKQHKPIVLIDGRMRKKEIDLQLHMADLVIGLGPGFTAGKNCHAAIETNRGHFLGRVYWQGSPQVDTGIPGEVLHYSKERVLHAPVNGQVKTLKSIGDLVNTGDEVICVADHVIRASFPGIVRGLIHDGLWVKEGMKLGDIDPRPEFFRCWYVSEKSLAIGGGVLEAIMTKDSIRKKLWAEQS